MLLIGRAAWEIASTNHKHYPDLGSSSDWSCRVGNLLQPISSTTQIWVVTCHQYGISAVVSPTLSREETRSGVAKCGLFSQADHYPDLGSTCDWLKQIFNQSEALLRSG